MTETDKATWYLIRISLQDHVQGKTEQLVGDITKLLRDRDPDPAIGIFTVPFGSQAVDLYFSPAVADLAGKLLHHHFAVPCSPPPTTAKHLFGSMSAIDARST